MGILNDKVRYRYQWWIVAEAACLKVGKNPRTRPKTRELRLYVTRYLQPLRISTHKEGSAMGMMTEFKEFAVKGNVMDLAVGVIIGGAFGKIVDSVVSDLIMPIVGTVFGKLDFSSLFITLAQAPEGTAKTLDALKKAGVPVFAYGNFITVAVNFAILAFIIFMMVKQINRLKKEAPAAPVAAPVTPEDVVLLREIRDSLKK
jgi:large conductance mechanosensitive channel